MEVFNMPTWGKLQEELDNINNQLIELDVASQQEFGPSDQDQFAYEALGQSKDAILDTMDAYKELNN